MKQLITLLLSYIELSHRTPSHETFVAMGKLEKHLLQLAKTLDK